MPGITEKIKGTFLLDSRPALSRRLLAKHWTTGGVHLRGLRSRLFRLAADELDSRYYAPDTPTPERERLKSICMAGQSAIAWAEHYLSLGFPEQQTSIIAMFQGIDNALQSNQIRTAHQVACCSGREIAYYARRYPEVEFTGSDCDHDLIEFLRETWKELPNLKFELLRLESPPAGFSYDLLYASGGLHYMDPPSLSQFLAWTVQHCGQLYLSQPMHRSYEPSKMESSTGRGMLSWNHPYPKMLQTAGWPVIGWKEGFLAEIPAFKNFSAFASFKKESYWPGL